MMNFQVALLITLVGIVGSAPVSQKLGTMDRTTIEQAHSLITKIRGDIPKVHKAWVEIMSDSQSLTLDDNSTRQRLLYLKKLMIPSAPALQNISSNFSLETCLAYTAKGLELHLNLLKEINNSKLLPQKHEVSELKVEIKGLLAVIKKLQTQAGFDQSKQASDEQSQIPKHDLAKHLTSTFRARVAAHLTLQQLQDFSFDVLHSILGIRNMTSDMST